MKEIRSFQRGGCEAAGGSGWEYLMTAPFQFILAYPGMVRVNFGGFVPLSTVDWHGRSVCTVFFRGCPIRCTYCHNVSIISGLDERNSDDILVMIRDARLLISGVVFSGGEPTFQHEALFELARGSRELGLVIGIQTNGIFPGVISDLIGKRCVDRVALDVKASWGRYESLVKSDCAGQVRQSLAVCKEAVRAGTLPECEVVVTLFRGYEDEVMHIASETGDLVLVLQQGIVTGTQPLSVEELKNVADKLDKPVKIRTRDGGEEWYEGNRCCGASCKR
jgi:pyruvate formate lyase activating enzyme